MKLAEDLRAFFLQNVLDDEAQVQSLSLRYEALFADEWCENIDKIINSMKVQTLKAPWNKYLTEKPFIDQLEKVKQAEIKRLAAKETKTIKYRLDKAQIRDPKKLIKLAKKRSATAIHEVTRKAQNQALHSYSFTHDRSLVYGLAVLATVGKEGLTPRHLGRIKRTLNSQSRFEGRQRSWSNYFTNFTSKINLLRELHARMIPFIKQSSLEKAQAERILAPYVVDGQEKAIPKKYVMLVDKCIKLPLLELIANCTLEAADGLSPSLHHYCANFVSRFIQDPVMSKLYLGARTAFANRRSVLLFAKGDQGPQTQVKFRELPWVKPLLKRIEHEDRHQIETLEALASLVHALFKKWPHRMVPNKIIQAFSIFYEDMDLKNFEQAHYVFPLIKELNKDVFQKKLPEFLAKAALTVDTLFVTDLYKKFYGLEQDIQYLKTTEYGPFIAKHQYDPLIALCTKQAGIAYHYGKRLSIQESGQALEHLKILTTQNTVPFIALCRKMGVNINCVELAKDAWKELVTLFTTHKPVKDWDAPGQTLNAAGKPDLQMRAEVSEMVQLIVAYLSMVDKKDALEAINEMRTNILQALSAHAHCVTQYLNVMEQALAVPAGIFQPRPPLGWVKDAKDMQGFYPKVEKTVVPAEEKKD